MDGSQTLHDRGDRFLIIVYQRLVDGGAFEGRIVRFFHSADNTARYFFCVHESVHRHGIYSQKQFINEIIDFKVAVFLSYRAKLVQLLQSII
jgi:hypothetical protein